MGQVISLKSKRNNPWCKPWFKLLLHTINCVCHSIRSMFRVLGIYNFEGLQGPYKGEWLQLHNACNRCHQSNEIVLNLISLFAKRIYHGWYFLAPVLHFFLSFGLTICLAILNYYLTKRFNDLQLILNF